MAYKRKIKHGYCLEVDEEEMEELKEIVDYYCTNVEQTEQGKELMKALFDKYY